VSRISVLTDQLRTFGRPDPGTFEPVALPTIFDKSMILMGERMRRNNVELLLDISPELPMVWGNVNKLEQVFINLLQNAMDAMESRKNGKIMVKMDQAGPGRVETTFSDTGPGIPDEFRGKIFEPFFTTKDVDKGTGLGLAIIYGIIREHQGAIRHAPTPASGSRFIFTLPTAKKSSRNVPP